MVIAIAATLPILQFTQAGVLIILIGVIIGAAVGAVSARSVHMTAMPQMVAAFNGVGGGAAALVSTSEMLRVGLHPGFALALPSVLSVVIGAISFAGSAIAFAKLQELMSGRPVTYPGQQVVNGVLALGIIALALVLLVYAAAPPLLVALLVLALLL